MDHLVQTLGIGLIVPDLVLVLALGTGDVYKRQCWMWAIPCSPSR